MGSVSRITKALPSPIKRLAYKIIPFKWRYGKKYRKTLKFITKSQWWNRGKLEDFQWEQLIKLLNHAYKNVPYYEKVFNDLGLKPEDIKSLKDFQKLPLLTKEIIKKNHKELLAKNFSKDKLVKFSTSGSTGRPLTFFGTKDLYHIEAAFISRVFSSHNSKLYSEKSIWLRRYVPEDKKPLVKPDHELNRLYFSAYHLSDETIEEFVDKMNKFQAKLLVAYPSSLYILALLLEKHKLKLNHIKVAHVASEKLLNYWKKKIEQVMKIPVKDHYGMMEKVSLFHQCSHSNDYHENLEYGLTEIINKKGGVGEVVGTSLYNYTMPLIRYKTSDMARLNSNQKKCSCGRGLPLSVKEFEGRADDILITPDKRLIPSVNFYTMMYKIPNLQMFKITQITNNKIEVQIVVKKGFKKSDERLIRKGIEERMGNVTLLIKRVKQIKRSKKTDKIRCVENKIRGSKLL